MAEINLKILCAHCRRPRAEHGETAYQIGHVWQSPGEMIEIPLVRQVTVAVRPHVSLEDTWEVYDAETGETVDMVEAGSEYTALEAAMANAVDYLKDDAKHAGW